MDSLIFFINFDHTLLNDCFNGLIRNVKKFHQTFPTPQRLLLLIGYYHCISPANIVSKKWLIWINIVLLRSANCQTKVDDNEIFVERMCIFYSLDRFVVFGNHLIDIVGISVDLLELTSSSKLLFTFCPLNRVFSFILLNFLIWFNLHFRYCL
jgi:hypothetical protein